MDHKLVGIYLNDHLAAGQAGVSLAKRARSANRGTPLAEDLERFIQQAEDDLRALREVMERLRISQNPVKQLAFAAGERLGRLKLNGRLLSYSPLSRVEELEGLIAGTEARRRLFTTLLELADGQDRGDLTRRIEVQGQHRKLLEKHRQAAATQAFAHP